MLAATNRPDVLDQALLRTGRFDRRVTVQPPDKIGREMILKVHTRGMPLASDVDLKEIAASRPGTRGRGPAQPGQRGGATCGSPRQEFSPRQGCAGCPREVGPRTGASTR